VPNVDKKNGRIDRPKGEGGRVFTYAFRTSTPRTAQLGQHIIHCDDGSMRLVWFVREGYLCTYYKNEKSALKAWN
jgi:hypothetical protein